MVDSERALLAAVLACDNGTAALEQLQPEQFYAELHRHAWRAMQHIHVNGSRPDIVGVAQRMREHPNAIVQVSEWLNLQPPSSSIEQHINDVRRAAAAREAMDVCADTERKLAGDWHNETAIYEAARALEAITGAVDKAPTAEEAMDDLIRRVNEQVAASRERGIVGIPSGLPKLDAATGGWRPGLNFIAGWSSGGKSALLTQCLIGSAKYRHRWRLYSLDMPGEQFLLRIYQQQFKVNEDRVRTMSLTDDDLGRVAVAGSKILERGCAIDDRPRTIDSVCSDAYLMRDTYDFVVVDTLQSARIADQRATLVDATITSINALKQLSKRINKPVLITTQAKDPPDRRETAGAAALSPPTLNDLYGGRTITQEAACVVVVYRSDYGKEEPGDAVVPATLYVRKNQSGRPSNVQCEWNANFGRFEVME